MTGLIGDLQGYGGFDGNGGVSSHRLQSNQGTQLHTYDFLT